jgi:hypothetical protein
MSMGKLSFGSNYGREPKRRFVLDTPESDKVPQVMIDAPFGTVFAKHLFLEGLEALALA